MSLLDRWRERHLREHKPLRESRNLTLTLVDRSPDLGTAWAVAFHDCPGVRVVEGDLFALNCDALVSPANSFGDMSGGIDKAIDGYYGGQAQETVRRQIGRRFYGELPVGSALVTRQDRRRFRWLVTAPTMRVPGEIEGSINAYLALRAALVAVLTHNDTAEDPADRIRSLAVPGLGTGIGRISPEEAASQMRAAYYNVLGGGWRQVAHPVMAPFALGRAR